MLSSTEGVSELIVHARAERRCRYRRPFHTLAYVKLGPENGGILRDISDHGASLQAVAPLEVGQVVQMNFDLLASAPGPARRRMNVEGRVAWVLPSGQAGVEFSNFVDPPRRQLNEWIFANILSSIAHVSPVLSNAEPLETENLRLAPAARESITLPSLIPIRTQSRLAQASDDDLLLDWLLDRLSPRTLSLAIDALVLCVAALLFLVVALAVTQTIPGWLSSIGLTICVIGFCGVLYGWMCRFLGMQTAGTWLADHAVRIRSAQLRRGDPVVRFR